MGDRFELATATSICGSLKLTNYETCSICLPFETVMATIIKICPAGLAVVRLKVLGMHLLKLTPDWTVAVDHGN